MSESESGPKPPEAKLGSASTTSRSDDDESELKRGESGEREDTKEKGKEREEDGGEALDGGCWLSSLLLSLSSSKSEESWSKTGGFRFKSRSSEEEEAEPAEGDCCDESRERSGSSWRSWAGSWSKSLSKRFWSC